MAFVYDCAAVTHIGRCRANHEDNFFIGKLLAPQEQAALSQSVRKCIQKSLSAENARNRIFAVSDGMGGHKNGEAASFLVADALRRFACADTGKAFRKRRDKFAYIQKFQDMVRKTNREMLSCEEGEDEAEGMGATLSGVILFADEIVPFNIGDSSVFLYADGQLRKLTRDDNEAAWPGSSKTGALQAGRRLTKYFGLPESGGVLAAAFSAPIPLRGKQMILAASDGLTDSLSPSDIAGVLASCPGDAGRAAEALAQHALAAENGGRDNITAAVLQVREKKQRRLL